MFVDAGAAAGAAALASGPHSAFRKSFHFIPLRAPAAWAALYLVLHSCIVRACTGRAIVAAATKAATQMVADRIIMVASLFAVFSSREDHYIWRTAVRTKRPPATVTCVLMSVKRQRPRPRCARSQPRPRSTYAPTQVETFADATGKSHSWRLFSNSGFRCRTDFSIFGGTNNETPLSAKPGGAARVLSDFHM